MVAEVPQTLEYRGGQLNAAPMLELVKGNLKDNGHVMRERRLGLANQKSHLDFQDSPDDDEDTRDSQEYLNDLEEEFQERALLAKSKRFFKKC
ncbi:hypothetical protein Tco_0337115 [Tanacetum coccineum]